MSYGNRELSYENWLSKHPLSHGLAIQVCIIRKKCVCIYIYTYIYWHVFIVRCKLKILHQVFIKFNLNTLKVQLDFRQEKVQLNYQQLMQFTMFLSSHFLQQPNETQESIYKKKTTTRFS